MVAAVKDNYPQREIADAAFQLQSEIDAGERIVVGVNRYTEGDDRQTADPRHRPGPGAQADRPRAAVRAKRDSAAVERTLVDAARGRRPRARQPHART